MRINEDFLDIVDSDNIEDVISDTELKNDTYPFAIILGAFNEYINAGSRMFMNSIKNEFNKYKQMLDDSKLFYMSDNILYVQEDSLVKRFPNDCKLFSDELYNQVGDNKYKDYCGYVIRISKIANPMDLLDIYFYGDYYLDNEILKGRFFVYDVNRHEIIKKTWGGFLMPSVGIMREVWIKHFYDTCVIKYDMLSKKISFEDFVGVCLEFFYMHDDLFEPTEELRMKYDENY